MSHGIYTDIVYAEVWPEDGGPSTVEPCLRLVYRRQGFILTTAPREPEEVLIPLPIAHHFVYKPEIDGLSDRRMELGESVAALLYGDPVTNGDTVRVLSVIEDNLDRLIKAPPPPPDARQVLSRRAGIRDLHYTWTDPDTGKERQVEVIS